MRQLETTLKAAADPTRTRILKILEGRELCVCQIQAVLGLAVSTVSKHLALLKAADLVEDRRDGRWIHYRLATNGENPHATGVLRLLRGTLDREPRVREDRQQLRKILRAPLTGVCGAPRPGRRRSRPVAARRRGSRKRPAGGAASLGAGPQRRR